MGGGGGGGAGLVVEFCIVENVFKSKCYWVSKCHHDSTVSSKVIPYVIQVLT